MSTTWSCVYMRGTRGFLSVHWTMLYQTWEYLCMGSSLVYLIWILFTILILRKEVLKTRGKSRLYSSYSVKVFSSPELFRKCSLTDHALCQVIQTRYKSSGVVVKFTSLPWGDLPWAFSVQDQKPHCFSHPHNGRLSLKVLDEMRLTCRTHCLSSALVCLAPLLVTWSPHCKR